MPLNKAICKRCFIEHKARRSPDCANPEWYWENSSGIWPSGLEAWKDGWVKCPYTPFDGVTKLAVRPDDDPPYWCRYKLEHTVAE